MAVASKLFELESTFGLALAIDCDGAMPVDDDVPGRMNDEALTPPVVLAPAPPPPPPPIAFVMPVMDELRLAMLELAECDADERARAAPVPPAPPPLPSAPIPVAPANAANDCM